MDHTCLKKTKAAQHRMISDIKVAVEYFQTPHQRDYISGNTSWIGDVVRKVNHPARYIYIHIYICRYCGVDSRVRFDIFQSH